MIFRFFNRKVFWLLFSFSAFTWFGWIILKYFFLDFNIRDTVIQAQPVIHFLLYGTYWSSILHMNPLHDHVHLGLFLLSPFFYLAPSAVWISFFSTISYLLCPLTFLYYGKKYLNKPFLYVIPILWLGHDVFMHSLKGDNHAAAITMILVVMSFFFAFQSQFKLMWVALIAIALFKENLILVWISLGFFIWYEKKEKTQGIILICLGIIIGYFIYFWVMPSFSPGTDTTLMHLSKFDPFAFIDLKIVMLIHVLFSFAFIFVFYPPSLVYMLPLYGVYLISNFKNFFYLNDHYHDYTTAFGWCIVFYIFWLYKNGKITFPKWVMRYKCGLVTTILIGWGISGIVNLPYSSIFNNPLSEYQARFAVVKDVLSIRDTLPRDIQLWVPESLGIYFIDYLKFRSINMFSDIQGLLEDDIPKIVIYRKGFPQTPLHSDSALKFQAQVDQGVHAGMIQKLELNSDLQVIFLSR